jgi:hypothetical protein
LNTRKIASAEHGPGGGRFGMAAAKMNECRWLNLNRVLRLGFHEFLQDDPEVQRSCEFPVNRATLDIVM